MKNIWIAVSTVIISGFCFGQGSDDNENVRSKGKFGIGANIVCKFGANSVGSIDQKSNTLQLGAGLNTRYFVTNGFNIEAVFGYATVRNRSSVGTFENKDKVGTTFFRLGAHQSIKIAFWGDTQLDIGLGGVFGLNLNKRESESEDPFIPGTTSTSEYTNWFVMPTIRPEWFISPNLSFHTQVGIVFSILGESTGSGYSETGFNVQLFQTADLLGSSGFTFYF